MPFNLVLCTALISKSLCVSTVLSGTSVDATLYGEQTLRSAIGSQSQVLTLEPTLETSRVTFCSHFQDIFLPNRDENHPLKQDFEAAAVIVLIILSPSGCGIVEGVEEWMLVTLYSGTPFPDKCLFLISFSHIQRNKYRMNE